jgi:hypothetical protein
MSAVVEHAVRLAKHGLPVFPLSEEKRPICPSGFKDAVRDPDAVVTLWHRYPGSLIGVPTGTVSGIDVLDSDERHSGFDWLFSSVSRLPITRIHATRSGSVHVLFRHANGVRNSAGKIAPGMDVRGDGGYVAGVAGVRGCRSWYRRDVSGNARAAGGYTRRRERRKRSTVRRPGDGRRIGRGCERRRNIASSDASTVCGDRTIPSGSALIVRGEVAEGIPAALPEGLQRAPGGPHRRGFAVRRSVGPQRASS